MRELKFRYVLRDKTDNTQLTICAPLNSKKNGTMQFPIDLKIFEILSIDECIGLTDMLNKEIYNHDILEDENENRYEIKYNKFRYEAEGYSNMRQEDCGCIFSENAYKKMMVIGNSSNNPELLMDREEE